MNERQFEIVVSRCIPEIFGEGWCLEAQQLGLPSGRIDLLISDPTGKRHIVELKKGKANRAALKQAIRYADDFSNSNSGIKQHVWVVAHEVPQSTIEEGIKLGVKTLEVSVKKCHELMKQCGISGNDLLGPRKVDSAIFGGGGGLKRGLRTPIPNEVAFAEMPNEVAKVLREIESWAGMELHSGGMQTVIHYRGVKLGGINRKDRGGHGYISTGVIITEDAAKHILGLGFKRKSRRTANSAHEHIWWEIPWAKASPFITVIEAVADRVDRALGGSVSQELKMNHRKNNGLD